MTILRKLTFVLIAALVALGSLHLAAAQSGGALNVRGACGLMAF